MKLFRILTTSLLILCIGFLGYHSYRWWQKHQKRRGLFVYMQKSSPVTKRIPEDALFYVNLYNFKRIHEDLQGTKLYDVLAHWLDTGMSGKQKANPLLGGMLEKTILNIVGEEFGVALLPSRQSNPDFLAVARLPSGSEFLIKLGLTTAKNVGKLESQGETIYTIQTKNPAYPLLFVYVDDAFTYASSNLERLQRASGSEGSGPAFLRDAGVEPIPEDTFLFLRSKDPQVMALAYGGNHQYHLKTAADGDLEGPLPALQDSENCVLRLQTNGTRLFQQPAASYSIQSINGNPVAAMLLAFTKVESAQQFQKDLIQQFAPIEEFSTSGIRCFRQTKDGEEKYLCSRGLNVLLAQGQFELSQAKFVSKKAAQQRLPLTLKIDFHQQPLADYFRHVEGKDWGLFPVAKEFYFLSCIKQISGMIDGRNNEISTEIY